MDSHILISLFNHYLEVIIIIKNYARPGIPGSRWIIAHGERLRKGGFDDRKPRLWYDNNINRGWGREAVMASGGDKAPGVSGADRAGAGRCEIKAYRHELRL